MVCDQQKMPQRFPKHSSIFANGDLHSDCLHAYPPESPPGKIILLQSMSFTSVWRFCEREACFLSRIGKSPFWEVETSPALQALPTWLMHMQYLQMSSDFLWINRREKASVLVKKTKDVREIKSIFLQVPEVLTRRGDRNASLLIFSFTK